MSGRQHRIGRPIGRGLAGPTFAPPHSKRYHVYGAGMVGGFRENVMGRGLGKTQRQIIIAGRATAAIFDCVKTVPLGTLPIRAGHAKPGYLAACNQTAEIDPNPKWHFRWITDTATTATELIEKCPGVWGVEPTLGWPHWDAKTVINAGGQIPAALPPAKIAPAMWMADDLHARVYPDIFGVDAPVGQPTPAIRRERNSAKAILLRAIRTMIERGLIVPVRIHDWTPAWVRAARRREWLPRANRVYGHDSTGWLVVGRDAVAT